jgi:microcystin-dependent protein
VSDPFVGEVRLVGFDFAPVNWMICQGQTLPISVYEALYALIGTTYGGDGQQTFNIPNLAGRVPVHQGTNAGRAYPIGLTGGTETVSLKASEMPAHTHSVMAANTSNGAVASPTNNLVAASVKMYAAVTPGTPMNPAMVTVAQGGNLPHDNLQPFLVLNWIISLNGIFPTQG